MPQALSGKRRSMPKVCTILGDDNLKIAYRKAGNNHVPPVFWGDSFTMVSGATEVVIASGISFHGSDLVSAVAGYSANITASPCGDPKGRWYIEKNANFNVIKIKTTAAMTEDVVWDVKFMLGIDPDIEGIYCRGNRGTMPSYP